MCPFSSSLPPGEGPDQFSPASSKDWQPRRKPVNNACERCRRRKIRCDGETPCSTCSRFSLHCIRTQKPKEVLASEHQQALESRIHQLESQLATHVSSPMHGLESIDGSIMEGVSSPFDWQSPPPSLTVTTNYPTSYTNGRDVDLGSFSARSLPRLAICEAQPSPVPSFWSGTTRASSPERHPTSAPQLPLNPGEGFSRQHFLPPPIPPNASWEFIDLHSSCLKPHSSTVDSEGPSRRISVSSSSDGGEEASNSSREENENDLNSGPSFSERSRASGAIPYPSRFEAETLTSEFIQHLETLEGPTPYTLNPATFNRLCQIVYPEAGNRTVSGHPFLSVAMARFHVFLSMAIGMKVRIKDSVEPTNLLLDRCYELAIQQASNSIFWQEPGGIEAAQLLSIFASIRKETSTFQPKALQSSFSW